MYGILVGIFLPDNPVKAKFITERERFVAIERLRADQLGIENKNFDKNQVWEVIKDPKTWLMFFFNIWVSIPNGGLTNFAPLIIKGLGFTPQRSTLLMMPTGVVQTLSSYVCNFGVYLCARRFEHLQLRGAFVIGGLVIGMIATVLLRTLPLDNYTGRLFALYFSYFYLGPYIGKYLFPQIKRSRLTVYSGTGNEQRQHCGPYQESDDQRYYLRLLLY